MYKQLKKIVKYGKVIRNELLSQHTSYRVGGKADYFVMPSSVIELYDLIQYLTNRSIKYYILGGGTNVLAMDSGYKGVVICLKLINEIREYDDYIQVMAGTTLMEVCKYYQEHNYCGLEDATLIPGTVGAAVVGNAGAYKFTMGNIVKGVMVIEDGLIKYYSGGECGFVYRDSRLRNTIVLSVDIVKNIGCDYNRINEVIALRLKQPKGYSAGSVFKRVDGIIVSKMLDEMGLKGLKIGGARVSEVHAGFIINDGTATSQDISNLISNIKDKVYKEKGVKLEEEIKYIV